MNFLRRLSQALSGRTVIALVGPSGTGKSYRAKLVAQDYGMQALIDDGLLIQDDTILAGHSAKREKTYMGAVRVALFDDKDHRDEVAKQLQRKRIKKILILGTSEKMANKIALRLQLPPISKFVHIEDITTQEERDIAQQSRLIEGKHVIPVPAIEIKRSYPQIFYNSIKVFLTKDRKARSVDKDGTARNADGKLFEKSIVSPEFSKKDRLVISQADVTRFAKEYTAEFDAAIAVKKLAVRADKHGYRLIMTIDMPFSTQLTGRMYKLKQHIIDRLERGHRIFIEDVGIVLDKIIMDNAEQAVQKPASRLRRALGRLKGRPLPQ